MWLPIVAFGPVEEEPPHNRWDFGRTSEPHADPTVVEQCAQNGNGERGDQSAASCGEVGRYSRHNIFEDHDPEHDADEQRPDAEHGTNRLYRRDRLAADHVECVS